VRGAIVCSSEKERDGETERGSEVVISFSWFEDDSRVGEELFWRPSGVSECVPSSDEACLRCEEG
jgi:hypothetical protein